METTMNKQLKMRLSNKTKQILIDIICYLFILLFLYAAASKLMEYEKFELQIGKSPIITDYAYILVWLVPAVEIIISIMLLIQKTVLVGLLSAFALMTLFTGYIYTILNFSDHIPCSCGGVLAKLGWTEHLIFNITFVTLAILGILLQFSIKEKKAL